jgi:hypothetical protein
MKEYYQDSIIFLFEGSMLVSRYEQVADPGRQA